MMKRFIRLSWFLLLFGLSACGTGTGTTIAGNPATPPAPPAELPTALVFPKDVQIDVTAIDVNNTSAKQSALKVGDNVQSDIGTVADSSIIAQNVVTKILAPLQSLTIPTSPTIKHFEDVIFVNTGTGLQGSNQTPEQIKIDFADFDLDGDGVNEGCSGHTAALPICYRIWVGGQRKLAGVFETFPTKTDPGKGRLRGTTLDNSLNGFLAAIYDHQDPNNKSTEIWIGFGLTSSGFGGSIHVDVAQEGPDLNSKKTARMSGQKLPFDPSNPDVFQETGQFLDQQTFLSLSRQTPSGNNDYSDACVSLPDGTVVDTSNCSGLGLDVSNIGFLPFASESDVLLPGDFPDTPTF